MKAYLFWYKSDEYAPTEYVYVIAYSAKQARFFFYREGYTRMWDYSNWPIDEIEKYNFTREHTIGQILWANIERL